MFVGGKNIIFFIFISINCYEATLSKAKKKKDTCDKDGCEGVIVKVSTVLLNKTCSNCENMLANKKPRMCKICPE